MMCAQSSAAEQTNWAEKATSISFDVPSQSLEKALDAFSSVSNVQVLYETSLTSGRRSARIQGLLTPEAALNSLLAGTGLTAWRTTNDSYSLLPQRGTAFDDVDRRPQEVTRYGHFLGVLQAEFLGVLCQRPETRPGRYKVALKFSIGPSGGVQQVSLLDSTGDSARDAEIVAAVERVTVGEAAPPELAQPITTIIAPRSPDVTGDCTSADGMRANR